MVDNFHYFHDYAVYPIERVAADMDLYVRCETLLSTPSKLDFTLACFFLDVLPGSYFEN